MADFQNQKERIKEFINSIGMTNSSFEKSLSLSNGYINSMRKGLGYDKLEQISIVYPELNMGWLLTGEGNMLNGAPINKTSKLAEIIKELGLSSAQLAEKIGIKEYSVEKMLSGELPVGPNTLKKLESEFNINPEWITRNKGTMFIESKTSPINADGDTINIEMEKELKRLRASIDALIEKNERLEAELAKYQEKESLSKNVVNRLLTHHTVRDIID